MIAGVAAGILAKQSLPQGSVDRNTEHGWIFGFVNTNNAF